MTTTIEPDLVLPEPAGPHAGEPPTTARAPSRWRRAGAAVGLGLVGVAVVVGLWALAAARVAEFPSVGEGISTLRDLLREPFRDNGPNDKGIGWQLTTSLGRVAWGFALAVAVGVPLGLAMGVSRRWWQAANPVIQFLRPVSPLAWYPIWLVVLKDVDLAARWVIFITAVWPIVLNAAAGAQTVPRDQREVARVFRFSRRTYVRQVLLPNAMPSIVTGMRQSMGVAWMVIVAAEMLSGGVGIGSYIWNTAYNGGSYPKLLAAVILIGGVGLVLDLAFVRLGRAVALDDGSES